MQLSSATPDVATPRVMGCTAGFLYTVGGCAILALAAGSGPGVTALWLVGTLAVACGGVLLWAGRRLPHPAFHGVVLAGTALISTAVAQAPSAQVALAVAAIYAFVAIGSFLFFSWRQALVQLLVVQAAQSAALLGHPGTGPEAAVAVGLVCVGVSLVVGALVQRASSASRDGLTGLLNRHGFDVALEAAAAAAVRGSRPPAVALLDLDRFKAVNDGQGRAAGDQLLRSVALACQQTLPAGVLVARLGGDEFALLFPGATAAGALARVEQVRAALQDCELSGGVAQHLPGESGAELLRRAETALYAAKAAGRGRVEVSGADADDLAVALSAAIDDGVIAVAFQPVLSLPDRQLVGVEALARWWDPERGAVRPDEFIPVAERTGQVPALGRAVLTAACRQVRTLQDAAGRPLLLTVNVSGRELVVPGYSDSVLRTLAETGWPAERLVLEVTESVVDASSGVALETLAELRGHGIAIAIDDFGTGYSSFSRLDTLPADYLKLDSTFIATTTSSPRRAGMLQALLSLSRTLGLTVIAEGVETEAHEALLVSLGCPLVQGYLYDPPRPVDELVAALRAPAVAG
ncbi:bifunctional diguanylate cyclase/phosphodiesterase [Geodermatophilus sp. DSM 44513]|uniref:putative bifunctional diguanylate cyclase/phosphodiesterase n=1 Tax=Geodermatophilus sp. DSM 44513 TaxID=1528104 RepID=UPI00141232DF|nr:GGDEF domain-containing phosphodiesterase [Geodermatophilus sp. DSM 44513]WNV75596.1 EAL domain-containing protein [Geodermatophilus sp. DSM 44513]